MTIKRIAAGYYVGSRGEIRNIKTFSGASHTRCSAVWVVTEANGRTELVRSLEVAKQMIG